MKLSQCNRLLLFTQLLTLVLLVFVAQHYRIHEKFWQRFFVEKRILIITPTHELNHNYQSSRALFLSYNSQEHPILFFGDSHLRLASWGELLNRADIANRGIDGDTLAGVTARLSDEANARPIAIVILAGTNDLLQGSEPEAMKRATRSLLSGADRHWPGIPLFMTSVPPVASWWVNHQTINAHAREFNAWLESEVNQRPSVEFIDLHRDLVDSGGNLARIMTYDGIHLSSHGYEAYRRNLVALLPAAVVSP